MMMLETIRGQWPKPLEAARTDNAEGSLSSLSLSSFAVFATEKIHHSSVAPKNACSPSTQTKYVDR